jgi:ribonuclease-3 family protein
MNNLVLAYLGDAVYELYIREKLINDGITKVKNLQKEAINYVSATAQSNILQKLINNKILTVEEIDIIKRGRNAHSHSNKSTDIITYKKATGFECLIGYLYLNDKKRLNEIMEVILNESIR